MGGVEHIIVCGVDGSTGSQLALEWAIEEAVRRGCTLRVVTAWSWDGLDALGAPSSPAAALSNAQDIQDTALVRAFAAVDNVPEVDRVMSRDVPSDALCAATLDAELLVLGSHGHGPVHDKLVGSTSQRASHHASCPVVILPDPRHVEKELRRARSRHPGSDAPQGTASF